MIESSAVKCIFYTPYPIQIYQLYWCKGGKINQERIEMLKYLELGCFTYGGEQSAKVGKV